MLGLEPWVHYVPLDYRLETIDAALDWADAHVDDIAMLVENAHAYAHEVLSSAAIEEYFEQLLVGYAALLRYELPTRARALSAAEYLGVVDIPRTVRRTTAVARRRVAGPLSLGKDAAVAATARRRLPPGVDETGDARLPSQVKKWLYPNANNPSLFEADTACVGVATAGI